MIKSCMSFQQGKDGKRLLWHISRKQILTRQFPWESNVYSRPFCLARKLKGRAFSIIF